MTEVFVGSICHTKSLKEFEVFANGFVAVSNGKIIGIGNDYEKWKETNNSKDFTETKLSSTQFLLPGFIDCHIHAPQIPNIGLGLDKPLLEWLETYTFPLESKYSDEMFAQQIYEKVIKDTIKSGTTFASYFATNHKNSTLLLAKEAIRQGQRAFIGKVSADNNCPNFYVETCEESLNENVAFIEEMLKLNTDLVKPIITPRFAISCTKNLLTGLGKIAKKYDLHIQSHISENLSEIDFVNTLFGKSYAQVYADYNLLTKKCIMAHGVHLEDDELKILNKNGTSIAHCPASNTQLGSGLCDVKRLLNAGIKVGLGTDVSGGNSASIHDAILRTMDVSQHISFIRKNQIKGLKISPETKDYIPLNYKEAIYLATLGGAEALAVDKKIGNFQIGKEFDALLIDIDIFPIEKYQLPQELVENKSPEDKIYELVQKFIYVGDDRNISQVFVQGKRIK